MDLYDTEKIFWLHSTGEEWENRLKRFGHPDFSFHCRQAWETRDSSRPGSFISQMVCLYSEGDPGSTLFREPVLVPGAETDIMNDTRTYVSGLPHLCRSSVCSTRLLREVCRPATSDILSERKSTFEFGNASRSDCLASHLAPPLFSLSLSFRLSIQRTPLLWYLTNLFLASTQLGQLDSNVKPAFLTQIKPIGWHLDLQDTEGPSPHKKLLPHSTFLVSCLLIPTPFPLTVSRLRISPRSTTAIFPPSSLAIFSHIDPLIAVETKR